MSNNETYAQPGSRRASNYQHFLHQFRAEKARSSTGGAPGTNEHLRSASNALPGLTRPEDDVGVLALGDRGWSTVQGYDLASESVATHHPQYPSASYRRVHADFGAASPAVSSIERMTPTTGDQPRYADMESNAGASRAFQPDSRQNRNPPPDPYNTFLHPPTFTDPQASPFRFGIQEPELENTFAEQVEQRHREAGFSFTSFPPSRNNQTIYASSPATNSDRQMQRSQPQGSSAMAGLDLVNDAHMLFGNNVETAEGARLPEKAHISGEETAEHASSLISIEELEDPKKGRSHLERLAALSQSSCSRDVGVVYDIALQLLFYLLPGRTVWQYMTSDQHNALLGRASTVAYSSPGGAEEAASIIKQLVSRLVDVEFSQRFRMPEDVDNYAYDLSLESRGFIDATLNKLWTMLLSGLTFSDGPEEGSDAIAILRDVMTVLKQTLELTTKAEVLCMAKMLWPRFGFESALTPNTLLASFYEDLNNQLSTDELLVPQASWVQCSAWANELENSFNFATGNLPQKRHSGGRVPDTEFMRDLPTKAFLVNGTDIQVPILPVEKRESTPEPPQRLLGLENYMPRINNIYEAAGQLQSTPRRVSPDTDDIDEIRQNFDTYQQRIFEAMVTLPSDADDWQQKQWNRWQAAIKKGTHTPTDVEAASWLIVELAMGVHERGVSLPKKYDLGLNSWIDNNVRCSVRVEAIISALQCNKVLCLEMMEQDSMLCFVAAPNATLMKREKSHKKAAATVPVAQQPRHAVAPGAGQTEPTRALKKTTATPALTHASTPTDGSTPASPSAFGRGFVGQRGRSVKGDRPQKRKRLPEDVEMGRRAFARNDEVGDDEDEDEGEDDEHFEG